MEWSCVSCSGLNYAFRDSCQHCGYMKDPNYGMGIPQGPGGMVGYGQDAVYQAQQNSHAYGGQVADDYSMAYQQQYTQQPMYQQSGFPAAAPQYGSQGGHQQMQVQQQQAFGGNNAGFGQGPNVPFGGAGGFAGGVGGSGGGKPGDWNCLSCGNNNFAFRDKCNRCDLPKPGMASGNMAGAQGFGMDPSLVMGFGGVPARGNSRPGDWLCAKCNNSNFSFRDKCNKCQAPKSKDAQLVGMPNFAAFGVGGMQQQGGAGGRPGDWTCAKCSNINFSFRDACFRCEQKKPDVPTAGSVIVSRTGDWLCGKCQNVNFSFREQCNRCQAEKSEAALEGATRARDENPMEQPPAKKFRTMMGMNPFLNPMMAAAMMMPNPAAMRGLPPRGGPAPKPGDWICTKCSNSNFSFRDKCNKCDAEKTDDSEIVTAPAVLAQSGRPGDWVCKECSNHNYAFRDKCFRCEVEKPDDAPMLPANQGNPGDWTCKDCSNLNFAFRDKCNRCQKPKEEVTDAA